MRINKILVLAMLFLCGSVVNADVASKDASQALQQLQLLQQKLSGSQNKGVSAVRTGQATKQATNQVTKRAPKTAVKPSAIPSTNTATTTTGEKMLGPVPPSIADQAFKQVTDQLFPLSGEQIIRLHQLYNASEFAQAATPGTPPRPTATSQFVNLAPGATPPVIRLARGFVTSMVFLDSTGAPWPISAYDLGDPSAFNIQWDKTGNTMMIQASKLYTYGNLAIRLQGLNTPVMMTLVPGQKAVDYRVDLRMQGYGPNAKMPTTGRSLPPTANQLLLSVLDGVPPAGSSRLTVSGGDAKAWLLGDKVYVRTRLTVLSPGWISTMTSADGMHVYEMQKSPVLLVSWHGKVMQVKLEGL